MPQNPIRIITAPILHNWTSVTSRVPFEGGLEGLQYVGHHKVSVVTFRSEFGYSHSKLYIQMYTIGATGRYSNQFGVSEGFLPEGFHDMGSTPHLGLGIGAGAARG